MQPEISVIIPVYNREDRIVEALESVLAQDYWSGCLEGEFEVLVVDDGSTDRSADRASAFGLPVILERISRSGVSAARNRGLERARGRFIAFLDSDDMWRADKMSIQMGFLKTVPSAVFVDCGEEWVRNGRTVNAGRRHHKPSGRVFEKVLGFCLLSLSSALFRRRVFDEIGRFDERIPVCEDYDFQLRLAARFPWHQIEKKLVVKHGGHSDQLSRRFHGMDLFRIRALEKALTLALTEDRRDAVKAEIVRKSRILLQGCMKRGRTAEAESYRRLIRVHGGSDPDDD